MHVSKGAVEELQTYAVYIETHTHTKPDINWYQLLEINIPPPQKKALYLKLR